MTPGHHQLQGTLDVALSVEARSNADSVVPCYSCLICVSIKLVDFATTESSKLQRFRQALGGKRLKYFKRVVTLVVCLFRFCFIIFSLR